MFLTSIIYRRILYLCRGRQRVPQPKSEDSIFLEESSKNVSIPTKPKPYNILNILNILNDRKVTTVYASKKLMNDFSQYAKGSQESVATNLENALAEYMINHPLENHTVIIQHVLKESISNGVQHDLEEQLLCSDIKGYLDTLERIKKSGRGDFDEFKLGLYKVVVNAVKFRDPTDKLLSLLQQVKDGGYFE
jgi:hypothetical protein